MRFAKVKTPPSKRTKEKDVDLLIAHEVMESILYHAKMFCSTGIIIAMDSPKLWRKQLYPEYKQRDREIDIYSDETKAAANLVYEFFRDKTAAMAIAVENCEADDIISYCVERKCFADDVIILSTDTDYVQLIGDGVRLYSPVQRCFRESADPSYDLFVKCIRGDSSDNIKSAYPRVFEKKLSEAYADPYKMLNLMETVLTTSDGNSYKVGDKYEFNKSLIDLRKLPSYVVDKIDAVVSGYVPQKYSTISAIQHLTTLGLKKFPEVLAENEVALKTTPTLCKGDSNGH
jgi:hypothetical protein